MAALPSVGEVIPSTVVALTAAQAAVVISALADARHYCQGFTAWCIGCAAAPTGVCPDHLADLDQAHAYRVLAAELARETKLASRSVCAPRLAPEPLPHNRERNLPDEGNSRSPRH